MRRFCRTICVSRFALEIAVMKAKNEVRLPLGHRSNTARIERLEARVSRETKALCQKAARIQGSSLTDFVVNSTVEAAKRIIRENEFIELTYRDRKAFVEALLNPPSPNTKLRKAVERHSQRFVD